MPFKDDFLARFRWIDGHADVIGLLADGELLAGAVKTLAEPFEKERVTKVAAVEARGFILGAGVALVFGVGLVAIRKPGSIHPGSKVVRVTSPDWRGQESILRLQRSTLAEDDSVLLVDDWAETGSQALASRSLIEDCGASYAGLSLLVDQLRGRRACSPGARSRRRTGRRTAAGRLGVERLGLDHEGRHTLVRARLVLLALIPQDGLTGSDRLALTGGAAHPAGAAHDDEELGTDSRVPRDDTAGRNLDHHGVSFRGQAAHPRADASWCSDLAIAVKLDAPHTRSMTAAIAWPKPMHIVATP